MTIEVGLFHDLLWADPHFLFKEVVALGIDATVFLESSLSTSLNKKWGFIGGSFILKSTHRRSESSWDLQMAAQGGKFRVCVALGRNFCATNKQQRTRAKNEQKKTGKSSVACWRQAGGSCWLAPRLDLRTSRDIGFALCFVKESGMRYRRGLNKKS